MTEIKMKDYVGIEKEPFLRYAQRYLSYGAMYQGWGSRCKKIKLDLKEQSALFICHGFTRRIKYKIKDGKVRLLVAF